MGNFIKRQSPWGFTLVELLMAILVSAIILAFGIPAFNSLIEKTRIKTTASEIVDLLRLARLTAVEESTPIIVCGSSPGSDACSNDAEDWGNSILVIKPVDDGPDQLLNQMTISDRVIVRKTGTAIRADIEFTTSGWSPAGAGSFYICPQNSGDDSDDNAIRIKLALSGKVSTETHPGDGTWSCQ